LFKRTLHYGVSQDDAKKLKEIVNTDFGGELDLVVDDASHFYEQTKTSFKTLFPLVRLGGLYIVEDWSWSFQDDFQDPQSPWWSIASPANLLIELMEDMTRGKLILDIQITRELLKIRRSNLAVGQVFVMQARRGRKYNLL
jgi:cephalosporin hydroxylase